MVVRPHGNSDRLRTIWTPEMDRYFIDLMLDQVTKGNRIDDHLFSKRAWKHMTLLFNSKFKFHYEKDVLKNRHKTLRNLYKAINNLLGEKGFSWDDNRQMVTADNEVWDDYIKVHPDARSYRIKTIPYFSDLCQIYRTITTEGNCDNSDQNPDTDHKGLRPEGGDCPMKSFSEPVGDATLENNGTRSVGEVSLEAFHEIMTDEDFGVSISKEFGDGIFDSEEYVEGAGGGTRSRTYWQPPMDRYFIDLMVDQVQKGNQVDGLFRKPAWLEMIDLFNNRFGFKYDLDILKNRYKTLRRQYNLIKKLLQLDGFFWDDRRQMVTADDCVWQDYIKAHSDARQYMTRPVPYYKDLCIICKEVNTTGRENHSSDQQDEIPEARFFAGSQSTTGSAASSDDLIAEQESSHSGSKRLLENPPSSEQTKRGRSKEESMANALREMAAAVSCLAEKRNDEEHSNSIAVENVIAAIQALPDMDDDLILDACDFLEDEKKAKTFLALDVKLRRKWLIRKLPAKHKSPVNHC